MARIKPTKIDKARVIVCALYALPELPAADDKRVQREARKSAAKVAERHALALRIIEGRG